MAVLVVAVFQRLKFRFQTFLLLKAPAEPNPVVDIVLI